MVCERLERHLTKHDFSVETFTESQKAIDRLQEKSFDAVVTDLKMKGPTGLEILHFVRNKADGTQVIIITGFASIESVREAEYGGVFEFVTKPFRMDLLTSTIRKAVKKSKKERNKHRR